MDLNQYVQDATTTESVVEVINVDPALLAPVINIIISAGTMLDQIKKNAFYGKPFDTEQLKLEFVNIVGALNDLQPVVVGEQVTPEPAMYNTRIFHAVVGIVTEAVELLEGLHDENFDKVNFLEELGDLNWYEAIGISAVDGDFEEVLNTNINKLRKRYPEKFDSTAAIERDTDAEREVLDSGFNDDGGGDRGC